MAPDDAAIGGRKMSRNCRQWWELAQYVRKVQMVGTALRSRQRSAAWLESRGGGLHVLDKGSCESSILRANLYATLAPLGLIASLRPQSRYQLAATLSRGSNPLLAIL